MPYSFNPLSGNLDYYKNSTQTYTEFVFNSSGSQSGNRYNTWADLVTALSTIDTPKRITFEQTETLSLGSSINLDNTTLRGNGTAAASGGLLLQASGGSIGSWANARIEGGLGFLNVSGGNIISFNNLTMTLADGSAIASFGGTPFFSHSSGTWVITMTNGSALYAGSIGGGNNFSISGGTTILIAGSSNSVIDANMITGSSGTVQIISGDASSAVVYNVPQTSFTGTLSYDNLSQAENVKYDSLTNVSEKLTDLDSIYGDEPVVTGKVMRLDYAGNTGTNDGAWSTPDIGNLTSGVDIRAKIWFDYPSDVTPPDTDQYFEVISQEHPTAGGGDTFEAAIFWSSKSLAYANGLPYTFYEAAPVGVGTAVETNAGRKRAGLRAKEWVNLRWTQDFATETVTYWRQVPFEVNSDCEYSGGIWWYPVSSVTDPDFAGIDTASTADWWIGKRFTGYMASLKMTNFAGTTTYIDINEADLDALSLGATSFTDDAGNTWTTVAAGIVNPPDMIESGDTYSATNVTTDRTFDANATTINELADVLGTLITDLKNRGVIT